MNPGGSFTLPAPSPPPIDVDFLQKLWEASTPGEWRHMMDSFDPPEHFVVSDEVGSICGPSEAVSENPNYIWIAAAHNAFPVLLAEIRELREENRRLRGLCDLSSQLLRTDELASAESRLSEAAERERGLRKACELASDELTRATWAKGADQRGLKYAIEKCQAALASQPIQPEQ